MEIIEKNIDNRLKNEIDNKIENNQNNFLETGIRKIINTAINVGLRFILPDILENEVIKIKDSIIDKGFEEGIKTSIKEGIKLGKSAIGIFNGKFENINQMQEAIKKGGILDSVSKVIDFTVDKANKNGKISNKNLDLIKNGKKIILDNISTNIEELMIKQIELVENLNNYSKNWRNYFKEKDFIGMDKEYKKIKNIFQKIVPLETIINEARKIENIHQLIKNNGQNFHITENEIKLAEML